MSRGTLPLSPASPGGQVEDVEEFIGAGGVLVVRQTVQLGGATEAEIARVINVPPVGTEYALVVRPISPAPVDAAVTKVPVSVTSVTLFDVNAGAKARKIYNDSSTATLYIKEGANATLDDYSFPIGPDGFYEFKSPVFAGRIDGIWDMADAVGAARLTEEM